MPFVTVVSCQYCGEQSFIINQSGSVIHCPACTSLLNSCVVKILYQKEIQNSTDLNMFKQYLRVDSP